MTKQDFLVLLADNQMQQLFTELRSRQNRYQSDLILLESQWSDLQTRERNGILSHEQAQLEASRIRKNLLDLIERSFGSRLVAPASVPSSSSFPAARTWIMVGAALAVVVVAWLSFRPMVTPGTASALKSGGGQTTAAYPKSANESSVPAAYPTASNEAKMLTVPPNPFTIDRGGINDMTIKILSAELSEQNPTTWRLFLKMRAIKPANGGRICGSTVHLAYSDFEKGPVAVDFAFCNRGETEDGTMEFEIPKEYHEGKLLFYGYSDEPPLASIPLQW